MSYEEALQYINDIPMFQNVGQSAYNPSLDRTERLVEALGNPHKSLTTIHIAGTNGKGSSSWMMSYILRQAGLRVGLYTSPHLTDYRERITVNGEMISKERVVEFMDLALPTMQAHQPSFFEFTTALAFWAFEKEQVDIAVIETGLGGLVDSTNIILPLVSLITNISIDHSAILGNSLEEIAQQKGGIIKPNTPVVVSEYDSVTAPIFEAIANEQGSQICFADKLHSSSVVTLCKDGLVVELDGKDRYVLGARGAYQAKNLLGVLAVMEILAPQFGITQQHVIDGLKECRVPGRWHLLNEDPLTICDVGHNPSGLKEVVQMISLCNYNNIYMVLGFMADKDISSIVDILPQGNIIATEAPTERSMKCEVLKSRLEECGREVIAALDAKAAYALAQDLAGNNDMIFVGGSTFIVAEIL